MTILPDIINIVFIVEITKGTDLNKLVMEGFIIHPPAKHKRAVGKIPPGRISFNNEADFDSGMA
jgi:hypothetical protein